ncbi:hypothetical protein F4679DRAFT_522393 [Xylaria curta]|nr:hypothetical protein F4679DRAFT_522393 [Xylaria curta]
MSSPQVVDVDVNTDSPVASFPQFTRLPLELRLIIWEMAMDEPRSIRILKDPYPQPRTLSVGKDNYYDAPGFFFVNQECRTVATKVYTDSDLEIASSYPIWVNMKVKRGDRLVISCNFCRQEQYLHYVEREQADRQDEDIHDAHCCSNARDELHDWLLSLLSDGCISNPKNGLMVCRCYRTISDLHISIDAPFLALRNLNPKPLTGDEEDEGYGGYGHWKCRVD